ncbi:MAG: type II toxin-antitoxin system VapC family toxin [Rhodocyclaceae bacterium]|nr:type II toxin-antitoxin system VapC family toxin [Rhodocyclaceae bacterium]MCA3083835.1 type II toxin-antitoxin system VapC family toxin [Rhodocyclaceae bacterium]
MIALDSSVLIDVLTSDAKYGDASAAKLESAMERDDIVVCDVVLAEVAARVHPVDDLMDAIADMGLNFSPVSEQAAIRAGIMQRRFRERGGKRSDRMVADFLVGAHALMHCNALITRDNGFFRDYFKGLKIINPTA